ncbi:hypothetical protein KKE19_03850 [Patescibacteria group bacterium]|nr:hypothetical protein [Patescibacteria group bacterium]MBU4367903.1 hypothetical protein [Patescibacteria group bacterium]MBU4461920.1 hypothetical protein [Patescibacteria group bacterium]MCG2699863.1 hypothetical protein [Candidatus Parcubacteria bacterium]
MPKKIFDIIPPNLASDMENKIKNLVGGKKTKKKIRKEGGGKKPRLLAGVLVFSGVFLLLAAIYLYFRLASLNVEIWPVTEVVSFKQKITIEKALEEVDLENNKIPAQFIEEEKEGWQEFPATGSGSKEGIAQGTIRVYNKYSPVAPVTLVAKTRFLSDSGKLFRSVSKINLPAAQIKNGKVVPSWVDIKVTAVESGEAYNIGSASFSIPGLSGTAYYYSVYAESTESMTGGYESELKVVTSDDIDGAKDGLLQKLFDDTEEALKNRVASSNLVLFNNALDKSTIESSCSVKAGAEIDKFNCTAKVKISALVAKEADLKKIAKNYIISQVPEQKTILEETLVLVYNPELIDLKLGSITLNSEISAKIYPAINTQEISLSFMGKNSSQISDIIYSKIGQEVSEIKIDFWPFWVKKAPNDQSKINVRLKFSSS